MSADNECLWVCERVEKSVNLVGHRKIFRTRAAAMQYRREKSRMLSPMARFRYRVAKAYWGPEQ